MASSSAFSLLFKAAAVLLLALSLLCSTCMVSRLIRRGGCASRNMSLVFRIV